MPKPWEKAASASPQQPTSEPAPTGRKPWEKAAKVFSGGQSSANPVAKTAPKPAPPLRMSQTQASARLREMNIDPDAVDAWYNGGYKDDLKAKRFDPLAPKDAPIPPPPPLWEQKKPLNVAKALDSNLDKQLRNTVDKFIGGIPDPTRASIEEQRQRAQTFDRDRPTNPSDRYVLKGEVFDQGRAGINNAYEAVKGIGEDLIAPLQANENARTIVAAPLNFGQGFGKALESTSNNALGVGTDALNSALNLADPKREQFERPRTGLFDQNALLDEGGALNTDAAIIPQLAGQYYGGRMLFGKGKDLFDDVAKWAATSALVTPADAPKLADMVPKGTPFGDFVSPMQSTPGESTISGMMKNLGDSLLLDSIAGGVLGGVSKASSALSPKAPMATNAGIQAPRLRVERPDLNPLAARDIRSIMARDGAEGAEVVSPYASPPQATAAPTAQTAAQPSVAPVVPQAAQRAQQLIDGVDAGGVPSNPILVNRIARDLGLDVADDAPMQDTIARVRAALAQQAPTQPQTATAPPVPPVPPAAPTATAAAPQPTPAPVAPQPARQALGPAEQAVNAMPRKTREALWRALSNSGMNRQQAEAAIKSLNDLPEGQNSMFDFELVRRFGQQYPRLKTNLQAMGRDWAITIPKDPRKGSPNRVLDDNTSTQIKSEGEFIDRTARDVFGQPVTNTLEALETTRRTLSNQYNKLLDPQRPYGNVNRMRRADRPAYMERINHALERLTVHLQRPEIMAEVPAWVRDRVMLDVAKDMRAQGGKFLEILRNNDPQVAQLIDEGRPLRYTPELWNTLTNIYPTQVAHTLQSAYARAIREALSGPDVVARTAAEELIRLRGGSRVRANALDPDQRGYGLLYYLEEAVPGYRDVRKQYGDIMGAEEAAYLPESFFRIANNDVALDDWIKAKDELSPQQQAALKSGMTTQIQQALRKKHETLDPWELDQPDALSTPNLTTLSQQPVLNALEKAFGADGKKMADAIRAASTRTDRIRSIHPNYGPRSAINQEAIRNASNIYGDPWGSEQNVIDSVSGSLGAAGVLSALNPATAAAAPLLLTGAAAKGLWNQWKRNKQLTGEESEALADFFFRSRRPDLAEQVRRPRGVSAGDYAGAALRDASIGTVAAAASDGDLLNNDPNLLLAGAAAGAGAGVLRARGRDAASKIKTPRAPRTTTPSTGPAAPPTVGPRPLPGQTSNASPAVTGALVGGAAGYAAAPEDQKGLGLVAGIAGGGVVGNRLLKGAKPKAPPSAPRSGPPGVKPPPVRMGFGGSRDLPMDEASRAKNPGGASLRGSSADTAASTNSSGFRSTPEGDSGNIGVPQGNRQGALSMDDASRMQRAREQGYDAEIGDYVAKLNPKTKSALNSRMQSVQEAYRIGSALRKDVERYGLDEAIMRASDRGKIPSSLIAPPPYDATDVQLAIYNGNQQAMLAGARGNPAPKWALGERYGDLPLGGQSTNWAENTPESGVSVYGLFDPKTGDLAKQGDSVSRGFIESGNRPVRRVLGIDLGDLGSDGEPLLVKPMVFVNEANIRSVNAAFDPAQEQSSKLLAGMSGNAEAIGAGGGAVLAPDVDGDGDVSFGERAGAALTLGIGGNLLRRASGKTGAPNVRGPDAQGFVPKPPQKPAGGKPPPKGPGTVSRMVAGGAVGGIAGGVAGEAGGQEEDLTAEMNNTKKDIDDLNAALKTWDSLDVMGKQRLLIQLGRVQSTYVDKNGARRKFDDGTTGDRTEPLFKAYAEEKRAALEKAEAGLEALKKQSAYRQFQKEQNPFFDAVRELGPSGAMALAGAAATVLRIRGVGKSKAAVKVIEKDINDLLTNGPVKSLLKKGGAANTERNRAVNMNEFYRQGGAPDSKLPFNYGAAGYKPNPKAAKPGSLYSSKTTTKMDGVGSQFLRPNDIKVLGVGLLDSVAIMPFVSGAEEELKKAKEDVDNGNDSIEALRRVEKAKTDLAMYQTIQRIGWGLAGGGALGAAYRYKLPKPDIRGAEEEVAAIGGYLRSIAPPKTPRAPKALAPPATPQTPPVAGPPAQLLLPAPSPPLKKPKPKPKPKPKKP